MKYAALSILVLALAIGSSAQTTTNFADLSAGQSLTSLANGHRGVNPTIETTEQCPKSLLKNGVCTKAVEDESAFLPSGPRVTQVVGLSNRGGSNPDPKLLMQLGSSGKGEYLPLVFGSLSCNDPYTPAFSFANQLNQRFTLLTQLQNTYGNSAVAQQVFDFQSTLDNALDGWNVFSAAWNQVGWYCDAVAISVSGQSQVNPILDTKTAKCTASQAASCTTPAFSTLMPSNSVVLAIGVAAGPEGNPINGFVSPGPGCSLVGGELSPLGTIVEICGNQLNASANFGSAGGVGILTAFAIH